MSNQSADSLSSRSTVAANSSPQLIAFCGHQRITQGSPDLVARACHEFFTKTTAQELAEEPQPAPPLSVFNATTSEPVELNLRGTIEQTLAELSRSYPHFDAGVTPDPQSADSTDELAGTKKKRGRPKLGVVGREVTLLPRQWDWLSKQPGGASVTLRRLVDSAKRQNSGREALRDRQNATYRFMQSMGGDLPGYEEACRALFADDLAAVDQAIATWPDDLSAHVRALSRVG